MSVVPELAKVARVARRSTSAGLYNSDTNEKYPHSGGMHIYVAVKNGCDVERLLHVLHRRCWLHGLGWFLIGIAGQLLDRSIVDRVVFGPERLVFEGPPDLVPPLAQDAAARRPVATEGELLDTVNVCRPLSIVQEATLRELRAVEAARLAAGVAQAREAFVPKQAARLVQRTGMSVAAARRTVERWCGGVLHPAVELAFDDPDLAGATAGDVLANPEKYVGRTLADPLEGIDYGRCKAMVMRHADGRVWIRSFAHGLTNYTLKFDFEVVKAALEKAAADDLAKTFVGLVLVSDLDPVEIEQLIDLTIKRGDIGKTSLKAMLREARNAQRAAEAKSAKEQSLADRQDRRAFIPMPLPDAEWLPVIGVINEVLGSVQAEVPPLRDADRTCTEVRAISVPSLAQLSAKNEEVNTDE